MDELVPTGELNAMATDEAATLLTPVCASDTWVAAVLAGRPYADRDAVAARSDAVLAHLPWSDVEQALAAHPRIGDRAAGGDVEASWSRDEQSAAAATGDVAAAVRAGNVEYEQRFGHVFLICATGLPSTRILDALQDRLGNDADTERDVVRHELAEIARLRLAKVIA